MEASDKNISISLQNFDQNKGKSVYYIVVNNYFSSRSGKVYMKIFPDFNITGYTPKAKKQE